MDPLLKTVRHLTGCVGAPNQHCSKKVAQTGGETHTHTIALHSMEFGSRLKYFEVLPYKDYGF